MGTPGVRLNLDKVAIVEAIKRRKGIMVTAFSLKRFNSFHKKFYLKCKIFY
jgi:hypothetical protein